MNPSPPIDKTLRQRLIYTASFIVFNLLISPVQAENSCGRLQPLNHYDKTATVSHIYDGDTLRLSNGDKIRLIGINSPELGRKNKAADDAFAVAAKNALSALLRPDKSIYLRYGKEKKDRYGRYLAHAYLSSGKNIQAALLDLGLARAITLPPNVSLNACYLQHEQAARCKKVGIWRNTKVLQANELGAQHAGFQLVQGKVKDITSNKQGTWLNIDNKLRVGIRPDNLDQFDKKTINALLNQSVIVRGWLNKKTGATPFYIRVRHPSSIALSRQFFCR